MLFALWQRPDADPSCIASIIGASCPPEDGAKRFDLENGLLWATESARLQRVGKGDAVGWLYPSRPVADGDEPRGPYVRLGPAGLHFTCGPLPQYPLYYYRAPCGSFLVVCSSLAALVEAVPSGGINLPRLVALLSWQQGADPGATAFAGLRCVRACEHVHAGPDGIRSVFRVPRAGPTYRETGPEDLATELRGRLEASVARAAGDSKRIAVHVGGGLDSSGLLALAAAHCRGARARELQALAAVWESPGDDRPYLATLEDGLGIVALRLPPREAGPWFAGSLCTDAQPQPFGFACVDMLLRATGTARGAEVALVGAEEARREHDTSATGTTGPRGPRRTETSDAVGDVSRSPDSSLGRRASSTTACPGPVARPGAAS